MGDLRVQALRGVADFVTRDGERTAALHGQTAPRSDDGDGNKIVSSVPVPPAAVIVTGGMLRGVLIVQGLHERWKGWTCLRHRVIVLGEDGEAMTMGTAWTDGTWSGDSVLHEAFDQGLPQEANP